FYVGAVTMFEFGLNPNEEMINAPLNIHKIPSICEYTCDTVAFVDFSRPPVELHSRIAGHNDGNRQDN
ncbi:hypothetical protein HRED_10739, partial [Candidatus Haloredivivus sp. G17]